MTCHKQKLTVLAQKFEVDPILLICKTKTTNSVQAKYNACFRNILAYLATWVYAI